MRLHRWQDDEVLLHDLAEAIRETAELAPTVAALGRGAITWRTVDEDLRLAVLSFDSSIEQLAATRSDPDGTRVLVFNAAPLTVELEVTRGQIFGQIVPPSAGQILIETVSGSSIRVDSDDLGFFLLPRLPVEPIRLRCDTESGRLVTDWLVL